MEILFREWGELYEGMLKGDGETLPPLKMQYADYASQQRKWVESDSCHEQLSYWRTQLKEPLPLLQLPTDRARPAVQTYNGALLSRTLPAKQLARLKEFSREEQSTLFMTLLAV